MDNESLWFHEKDFFFTLISLNEFHKLLQLDVNDFFLYFLIWAVQMTEKSVLCTSLLLNILNISVKTEWMETLAN